MANTILRTDVMLALNNLMGRREMPGGIQSDLQRYCQTAFDYAWRYYPWSFSKKRVSVDLVADPYLPLDFDLEGWHQFVSTPGNEWQEVPLEEYDLYSTGLRIFTLEFNNTLKRYKVVTSFTAATAPFLYQITPPTLDDTTAVPFPSAQTIAVGAAIWAKQGENPTRADISQELELYHNELDRHTGRAEAHKPRQSARNVQDVMGTYTGDVGD